MEPGSASAAKTIILVGNPNTGKTTLFNKLTGFRQRVGNYPGVTVERKTGLLRSGSGPPIEIIDLPGAYSLSAGSADEAVVLEALSGHIRGSAPPDVIVCVIDAKNLQRNLFFLSQMFELGRPVVVALNMIDIAKASGVEIDAAGLSAKLGAPVIEVVATKGTGVGRLRRAVVDALGAEPPAGHAEFPPCVLDELDGLAASVADKSLDRYLPFTRAQLLQCLLDPDGHHEKLLIKRCGEPLAGELRERRARIVSAGEQLVDVEARVRYAWIDRVLAGTVVHKRQTRHAKSDLADRILTHPVLGLLVLVVVMGIVFQSIYAWSDWLMNPIEGGFAWLGAVAERVLPPGALQSFVSNGVVAGVGGVLIFLPQILILFLFIAVLEDCGYMSRAAFLLDRYMRKVGLGGKCFIPLLSCFACAVPGIMATRTIESPRDRLLTILVGPLLSCSARLPVYVLLIAVFVPDTEALWGITNYQTLTLAAMYFFGILVTIGVTFILKHTIVKGEAQPFLMELPSFKRPSARTVLHRIYERGWQFCIQAGTVIFAVTIVVWALGYYPRPASIAGQYNTQRAIAKADHAGATERIMALIDQPDAIDEPIKQIDEIETRFSRLVEEEDLDRGSPEWQEARAGAQSEIDDLVSQAGTVGEAALSIYQTDQAHQQRMARIDRGESGAYLRQSFLGRVGLWIEPVVRPLGWDWRIGTAVIASFPAREVVIATMATIYNLGGEQNETSAGLRKTIRQVKGPDGKPVFNLAVALSIMVFFALCCQCGATLATIRRETNSWRWPVFSFAYMTALAYAGAFATYQIAIRLI